MAKRYPTSSGLWDGGGPAVGPLRLISGGWIRWQGPLEGCRYQ